MEVSWRDTTKIAITARKAKAHSAHVKLQHVGRSRLCIKAKVRIFHSCIVSTLLHALDSFTLESRHLKTIDGWYFRYLRRAIGVKASFYSRISNQRVWVLAGRPILPTQILLATQLQRLSQIIQLPNDDPQHRLTKSAHRGHPRPYWFDVVNSQAMTVFQPFLDQPAQAQYDGSRDYLGYFRAFQNPTFRCFLQAAPTRHSGIFPHSRKSIGCAWQT